MSHRDYLNEGVSLQDLEQNENPRIISEKIRLAHKPHVCSVCNQTIERGEDYQSITVFNDGSDDFYEAPKSGECPFLTVKLHLKNEACNSVKEQFAERNNGRVY